MFNAGSCCRGWGCLSSALGGHSGLSLGLIVISTVLRGRYELVDMIVLGVGCLLVFQSFLPHVDTGSSVYSHNRHSSNVIEPEKIDRDGSIATEEHRAINEAIQRRSAMTTATTATTTTTTGTITPADENPIELGGEDDPITAIISKFGESCTNACRRINSTCREVITTLRRNPRRRRTDNLAPHHSPFDSVPKNLRTRFTSSTNVRR